MVSSKSIYTPALGSAFEGMDFSNVSSPGFKSSSTSNVDTLLKNNPNIGTQNKFMSPGMTAALDFGFGAAASYFDHQYKKYETQRANAVAEQKYYRAKLNKEKENYRNYEVDLKNWYRDTDWVEQRRAYEEKRKELQAGYKGEVTVAATKNFERMMANIEGRFYEEEARDIVQLDTIRTEMISQAVKKVASGQAGRTVKALGNQYEQQWLSNLSNRNITRRFRIQDKENQKVAAETARQNTSNAVQFYTPTPIADTVKPMMPLPVEGVAPTPAIAPGGLGIKIAQQGLKSYQKYADAQPSYQGGDATERGNQLPSSS
jgi:hypothetical protein